MSKPNINKYLYKVFLTCVKYTPITLSICFILNLVCNYYRISCPILSYIGGVSFIFIALLYLMSWVFQFCYLYRIPLHYVTIGNLLGLGNKVLGHPISSINMYRVYFILTGITIVSYIWFASTNRHNPKINYIHQLCDLYCL